MNPIRPEADKKEHAQNRPSGKQDALCCPVCGAELIQEKCKVVCRSAKCVYRIIYNCSEF